jgi:hypothetical protein
MPYAILRFAKRKAGGVASAERHNERRKDEYKSNPDIDMSRSGDNYHLVALPDCRYSDFIKERITEVGCKTRKDSVTMVETLITASPEFIQPMDKREERAFFTKAVDFIKETIGDANIISAIVHKDEKTPHLHLCFVPITKDGRLSAKEIVGNKTKLTKWQTDFHDWMSTDYPDLERGISASETKRKHLPLWLFKSAERLDIQFEQVRQALGDIGAFNAGKKRDEALAILADWLPDARKLTAQVKTVDGEIERLKDRVCDFADNNDWLRSQNYEQEQDIKSLERNAYDLQQQLKKQQRLLDKIPPEVIEQLNKQTKQRGYSR